MNDLRTRRTYSILAVIGRGGCGTVYRAVMEGSDGFRKEVAVKVMHEDDMSPEALMRFRDEARILGLVRDRAIVSVDAPTRLNGRLAVVMEYIEGASAGALLKRGAFPPTVALEIIQEVARVLDKVVQHPGPDGRPLNLLHRDLKPANVQITPGGEVKVLDFGIARATFAARESHTVSSVAGTLGYIAPERLSGVETPAGDVYSLGVLLRVLVTREKAVTHGVFHERGPAVDRTPEVIAVIGLAAEMCQVEPSSRPTAREVEDRCHALRQAAHGMTLRAWAEAYVPTSLPLEPDELVGLTLSETIAILGKLPPVAQPRDAPTGMMPPRSPRRGSWPSFGIAIVGLTLAASAAGIAVTLSSQPYAVVSPVILASANAHPGAAPQLSIDAPLPNAWQSAPNLAPEPLRADPAPEVSAPTASAPVATAPAATAVAPAGAAPPRAVPVPAAGTATPKAVAEAVPAALVEAPPDAVAGASWAVTFASVPGGADVRIDGVSIGTAPVVNHLLPSGSFTVTMLFPGGQSIIRNIQTGSRAPRRYVWDYQGGGEWSSY